LGISSSSRVKSTNFMLKTILDATGMSCDLINLKDKKNNPCVNCQSCHSTSKCVQEDDMQLMYQKLMEADTILLGSPTYFDNVSGIMKNFMDRCLPFYFSRKLEGKKVVVLSVGGFKNLIDLDENGECVWCKRDNSCTKSVSRCIDSLKFFANQLGMNVVGEICAIHGDPEIRKNDLIELGKSLVINIS
jgi:multimeric flavodoxin WrbA